MAAPASRLSPFSRSPLASNDGKLGHGSCRATDTGIVIDLPAAEEWIRVHADPVGTIESVHERPWATVLRVPLADGAAWFKACAPVQKFEPRLTADLFSRWPDRVPGVLGYDEKRAWLLLADAGTPVGAVGNPPEAWLTALPRYAELQKGETTHAKEHLSHGVPDLRLATLPVRGDELLQLADDVRVPAEGEIGLDPPLERGQAQLLEPGDRRLRERLVGEVGERWAAPEGEGLAQHVGRRIGISGGERPLARFDELLEPIQIEPARLDAEQVAASVGDEVCVRPAIVEYAAELQDVVLNDLRGRRRRLLAPELVDDPVGRERLVAMEEEQGEQGALLAAPKRDLPFTLANGERAENAEVHACDLASNVARSPG